MTIRRWLIDARVNSSYNPQHPAPSRHSPTLSSEVKVAIHVNRVDSSRAKVDAGRSFEGTVRLLPLVGAEQSKELEVLAVYFSAGARTRPHIHEKDQVLVFLEGEGIVATDTERKVCSAGDIVTVPGGTWHWHGGTRESAMHHLSIRQPGATHWDVELKNWGEY